MYILIYTLYHYKGGEKMPAKKKNVQKKAVKSLESMPMKDESEYRCICGMKMKRVCSCDIGLIKLASMAFILFLITVWPAAMNLVQRIHWGWFLGAMVLFSIKPLARWSNCCKK